MEKYIPNDVVEVLTNFYEKEDVWQIHSGDYWLVIFLYKDSQIEHNQNLPKYLELKEKYLELVHLYLNPTVKEIYLSFNSKENFEKKYGGNWYDYYH